MEQGEHRGASTPINQGDARPEPTDTPPFIRKHLGKVAATSLVVASLVAGVVSGSDQHRPSGEPSSYGPHTYLEDDNSSNEEVVKSMDAERKATGHTTGIIKPSSNNKEIFYNNYNFSGTSLQPPNLRELIFIRDRRLFAPEFKENPNYYPYYIYNATRYPLDMRFIDYALRATKSWLSYERTQNNSEINIEGHTDAKVEPKAVPHIMVMTSSRPDSLDTNSHAATLTLPNETLSFVSKDGSGKSDFPFKTNLPFRKRGIATEICQGLIKVHDVKLAPFGLKTEQEAMEEYISKDDPKRRNLRLAGQESVCNGLGAVVTAIYEGGQNELAQAKAGVNRIGLTQIPWIDFSLYDRQVPKFFALKKHALRRDNYIVTTKDSRLPTIEWYSHHESY